MCLFFCKYVLSKYYKFFYEFVLQKIGVLRENQGNEP